MNPEDASLRIQPNYFHNYNITLNAKTLFNGEWTAGMLGMPGDVNPYRLVWSWMWEQSCVDVGRTVSDRSAGV